MIYMSQWMNPRGIKERILVSGTLILNTPAHIGTGDTDGPLDMPLLLDPLEQKALLPGTSIAGALRNYLEGYDESMAARLFGSASDGGQRSPLIVDDALSCDFRTELRDGVSIDPLTRTSDNTFDMELLSAGTKFGLSFELIVTDEALVGALAIALDGLEKGKISLGGRKSRGFGRCQVDSWKVRRYDMTTIQGLLSWLKDEPGEEQEGTISEILGVPVSFKEESGCVIECTFKISSSLLIGAIPDRADAPDKVHLYSTRNDETVSILSGTSLAGALRARALRILNTLGKDGYSITDDIFGYRKRDSKGKPTPSRLWADETVIAEPLEVLQTRLKIDRFTGGAYPSALFNEMPLFSKADTEVKIHFGLSQARDNEVGLLLLLLKDLWTGDLPLGGGHGIGRGYLKGKTATLTYDNESWSFTQDKGLVVSGDKERLEEFVKSFLEEGTNA